MDINNVIKDYVTCVTNDGVTLPNGGTWISALCIYYGITEPINGSWIQAYCNYKGITTPVNGSWTIALANSLGITAPVNGSWWYAIAYEQCNGVTLAPIVDFVGAPLSISAGDLVDFTDLSTVPAGGGAISSWAWTFTDGTPSTSITQNPTGIQYNTVGQFAVSLQATNPEGIGSLTKTNYITVLGDLVWNTTDVDWNLEDSNWATDTVAPAAPLWSDFITTNDPQPNVNGTAEANSAITFVINAVTYTTTTDGAGNWTININQDLPGSATPGSDYLGSCTATDAAGNTSAATTATITSLSTLAVYEFVMEDTYGDGWNGGWAILQKETSVGSGVWTDVNFNGNPYCFNNIADMANDVNRKYYATDTLNAGGMSGPAGLRFERYDADDPNFPGTGTRDYKGPVSRFLDITPGESYRVVVGTVGSYPAERIWKLYDNSGTLLHTNTGNVNWCNPSCNQFFFTS
tara:strand:+ start:557 stop:1942 length:1386 start_codon:yes stop_codon:yes gene_type:complete